MSRRKPQISQEAIINMVAENSDLSELSDEDDIVYPTILPSLLGESSSNDDDDSTEEYLPTGTTTSIDAIPSTSRHTPFQLTKRSVKPTKLKRLPAIERSWTQKQFRGTPHPGPLDLTKIQNPEPVRSPIDYFAAYFPDDFFRKAAEFTNRYSVLKSGKSINTNVLELKIFFGLNLLMGCVPFPRLRMYWVKGYSLTRVSEFMSRDRFLALRNYFHLVDVTNPPENLNQNRLWKVQPVINAVRKVCLSIPRDNVTYSIDEQMIPFTGRCSLKQYVKNKPRPVGLKNFVLTTSFGLVLDFEVYQGESTPLVHTNLGLGPSIILRLVQSLPPHSFVYFDRYFTTIPLLEKLSELKIEGTGTIMANRVKGINLADNSKLKRGESTEYVSSDSKIVVVEWKDSNKVLMASTCSGVRPTETVKRWSKFEKRYIEVTCPSAVRKYNQCMGGVDICDQLIECYRTWFKTRKWTWKCILHFLDLAVVNAWMQYTRDAKANKVSNKDRKDLLKFRLELSELMIATRRHGRRVLSDSESSEEEAPAVKRSKFYNPPAKSPSTSKRYDGYEHFPVVDNIKSPRMCRMETCASRTKVRCEKCDVYLCVFQNKTCFKDFHTNT